jgi:oligopeptide transport system substrate-binding protein
MKSVLLLLAITFLVFGCSKENSFDEREINLISPEKISGYDPINSSDKYSANEVGKVYEGLFEFHPLKRPYELIPNLAESLPIVSLDGLNYTFKLRKGVYFHDSPVFKGNIGRELRAQDVVYSIKRLADPKLNAKGWWVLDDRLVGLNEWRINHSKSQITNYEEEIEGLKALDDHTLQIKLKKPYPQFLYALAMPYTFVVPREAVEFYGKEFLNYPVGTGAFVLPKFEQSSLITYFRNPKFREKLYPSEGEEGDDKLGLLADAGKKIPLVDKINVHVMVESQPKWLSFMKAKNDLLEVKDVNIQQSINQDRTLKSDHKEKGIRLVMKPMLDVTYFAFNHEEPIFKNKKLRQAMNLAFDRVSYNRLFHENTAFEAQGPIPPGLDGQKKEFKNPYIKYDVELAKKYLAEAGFPGGKGLPTIVVQTRSDTVSRQQVEFFEKCMEKIGINIDIRMNTWPELVNKVTKKQHQMYTMAWGADYPDAENFLGLLYCPNQAPGSNGANYCNPEFDTIFKQATVMQDSPDRTDLYEKLNEMIAFDVPWILGFHRTDIYLTQAWLKNFKHMEFNHSQFQYLNVDLEVKKQLLNKF